MPRLWFRCLLESRGSLSEVTCMAAAPNAIREAYERGLKLIEDKNPVAAAEAFLLAQRLGREAATPVGRGMAALARRGYGVALFNMGKKEEAWREWESTAREGPNCGVKEGMEAATMAFYDLGFETVEQRQNRASANALFQKAIAIGEKTATPKSREWASRAAFYLGWNFNQLQDRGQENAAYLKSASLGELAGTKKGLTWAAESLRNLGCNFDQQGRADKANEYWRAATKLGESSGDQNGQAAGAKAAYWTGLNEWKSQRLEQAMKSWQAAARLGEASKLPDGQWAASQAHNSLAIEFRSGGQASSAATCFQLSIKIGRQGGTAECKESAAASAYALGRLKHEQGQMQDAIRSCAEAELLGREADTPESLQCAASACMLMGRLEDQAGRWETAVGHWSRCKKIAEQSRTEHSLEVGAAASLLAAKALLKAGRHQDAYLSAKEGHRLGLAAASQDGLRTAIDSAQKLGDINEKTGDLQHAFEWWRHGIDSAKEGWSTEAAKPRTSPKVQADSRIDRLRATLERERRELWEMTLHLAALQLLKMGNYLSAANRKADARGAWEEARQIGLAIGTEDGRQTAAKAVEYIREESGLASSPSTDSGTSVAMAKAQTYHSRCPACANTFTVTGSKPLLIVCPQCKRKGVLR